MPEQTVKCPRCGQMVGVPTTGEKVRCPGCGQKFRYEAPVPPAPSPESPPASSPPPMDAEGRSAWPSFQREGDSDATPPPLPRPEGETPRPAAEPETKEVRCPDCGREVQVPVTGEKVYCECGRKFRFDPTPVPDEPAPAESPAAEPSAAETPAGSGEAPTPPPMPAPAPPTTTELKCAFCGAMVQVPFSGEKVHCPGCGQKYRFEAPPLPEPSEPIVLPVIGPTLPGDAPTPPPLPAPLAAPEAPAGEPAAGANEVKCPRCGDMVMVPVSGEKVRCPGCGQKFRFELPPVPPRLPEPVLPAIAPPSAALAGAGPAAEPAPPPTADELRALWPSMRQLVHRVYEDPRATDDDRALFRRQADRAAGLARVLLGSPGPQSSPGHVFLTSVLSEMTLDEILGLSLEDYRHLDETIEEVQVLLDERLPQVRWEVPEIVLPRPPAAAAPRRRRGITPLEVAAAVVSVAAVALVLIFFPTIEQWARRLQTGDESVVARPQPVVGTDSIAFVPPEPKRKVTTRAKVTPRPQPPKTSTLPKASTDTVAVAPPTFVKGEPEKGVPGTETVVVLPPKGQETPEARVFSRWKPGPDGWITLFDGRALNGLQLDAAAWSVQDGALYGISANASTVLSVQEADWCDYCLAFEARLGKAGTLVAHHGNLSVRLVPEGGRLRDPQRVLDEKPKGPTRLEWYRIEFDVKGGRAEVRVDGRPYLAMAGLAPQAGPPALEVQQGGVAFRSVRLRLHESDPDYRAVALGEGYAAGAAPPPSKGETPTVTAQLGLGVHRLFNGTDLTGWAQNGAWAVRNGTICGRSAAGPVASLVAGSPEWRDYTVRARCRIVRADRESREDEYYLVILRHQDPDNFYCVRFAIEGVYEIGYYRNGRFHEAGRARHGLGSKFNQWHDVEVAVHGDNVTVVIDNVRTGAPPWSLRGLNKGAVGIGVTGGEAAFENVRVHAER